MAADFTTKNYIFCCKCKSIPNYARDAADLILKKRGLRAPNPIIQENIYRILPNIRKNSKGYRMIEKYITRKGKFAFFVALDDDGNVVETINLLKGY